MHISVVIPTYGRPEELYNLLNRIKRQSDKPLEVIIVDDTLSYTIEALCKKREPRASHSQT
jgi:glycosyltransferase involved in cell wall biosynthesis